jgi:hypothetical protein
MFPQLGGVEHVEMGHSMTSADICRQKEELPKWLWINTYTYHF